MMINFYYRVCNSSFKNEDYNVFFKFLIKLLNSKHKKALWLFDNYITYTKYLKNNKLFFKFKRE